MSMSINGIIDKKNLSQLQSCFLHEIEGPRGQD